MTPRNGLVVLVGVALLWAPSCGGGLGAHKGDGAAGTGGAAGGHAGGADGSAGGGGQAGTDSGADGDARADVFDVADRAADLADDIADAGADGDAPAACGDADGGTSPLVAKPRLIAPLSTATVSSRRPLFRFALAAGTDGAHIEICRDRACKTPVAVFDATGDTGEPATDLPRGVLYWHATGRSACVTGQEVTPTWQLSVGAGSAPVDTSWGTTPDVNGDGLSDVVVGAVNSPSSQGGKQAGRAFVFMAGPAGLATAPAVTLIGPDAANAEFGYAVASAGDVNGDGYADVIVGAHLANSFKGAAYVYLGGAAGLSATPAATLLGSAVVGNFGHSVAGAGDVNGDGYADIIVGALSASIAYLYLGSATGIGTKPSATLVSPDPSSGFGDCVASAGDVNGDRYADVIVGAAELAVDTGRAYVYLGGPAGLAALPDVTLRAPDTAAYFGRSVTGAGDVNGDGYTDIVVGGFGWQTYTGRAYIYLGSATGPPLSPTQTLTGSSGTYADFGRSLAFAGDVNGDGFGDLVVGADLTSKAYVFLGSATGLQATPAPTLNSPLANPFGESVTGAGDVNGDGYPDVLVGATLNGRAYLYLGGGAAGVVTAPTTTLEAPSAAMSFGSAVAGMWFGPGGGG